MTSGSHTPKKALGQNFMINQGVISKTIDLINKTQPDTVVEIGPGQGAFTKDISRLKIRRLLLIEKDRDLATYLKEKFDSLPQKEKPNQVDIINEDFLDLDLTKYDLTEKTTFFGSLPYNVSKPIIRRTISLSFFNEGIFVIQKEVAQDYIATAPRNTKLSLLAKIYTDTKKHFNISPGSFRPVPKVDSSLISFTRQQDQIVPVEIRKDIEKLIIQCFTKPRKTVYNNLKSIYPNADRCIKELVSKRAEQLSLEDFLHIYQKVTNCI